jgi:phage baseplate assembly protein W
MSAYKDAQANNDISRNVKQYRDLDLFFSRKSNKDVNKVTDVEAVKRSVRNLVLLNSYEKPFHPEIAGDVRGLLFENMTPLTSAVIARKIQDVIENFEPRARLTGVQAIPDFDRNLYEVTVYFYVVNAPTELVEVTQLLERLR